MFKNLNEKDKKKIYSLLTLAVICGIALIAMSGLEDKAISSKDEVNNKITQEELSNESSKATLEEKLKNILSQIEGAGEVDVMITYESSEEIQPAFNTTTTEETKEVDQQGGERTVTTSSENKTMITSSSNEPIVIKTNQPKINGVIVVATGAKDLTVKETLYSAVQTALQVQGHQVEIYTK